MKPRLCGGPELAPVALLSDAAGPADGKASSVNTRCAAHLPRKSFGRCPGSAVQRLPSVREAVDLIPSSSKIKRGESRVRG